MSDAERYLRDLRRSLPIGCRRRFVAEVREHFASAADSGETEHLTIERLGPADALADQLLSDLRSGALGRAGRLTALLTATRLAAAAGAVAIAVAAGAVLNGRHSSQGPTTPQRTARPAVVSPRITLDPRTGEIRAVMYGVQSALAKHQSSIIRLELKPVTYYVKPAPGKN